MNCKGIKLKQTTKEIKQYKWTIFPSGAWGNNLENGNVHLDKENSVKYLGSILRSLYTLPHLIPFVRWTIAFFLWWG